jgi:predicted PurR-regulated permease PerM
MTAGDRARWLLPRSAVVLGVLVVLGVVLFELRGVLTPIFFAFLVAYLLDPVVDRLEARGLPRAAAIVLLLGAFLGILGPILVVLAVYVVRQVVEFAEQLPGQVERMQGPVEGWLDAHGVVVPHTVDEALERFWESTSSGEVDAEALASRGTEVIVAVGEFVLGGTASAIAIGTTVFLVPVFAFYLLYDFDRIVAGARDLVPYRYRPFVVDVFAEIDQVLGQFIRGQLLVMTSLAVLYSLAYALVGIRLAVPIGVTAGALSFIPYVGGALALVLALLMTAIDWTGWGPVVGVVVAYTAVQTLESFVITPKVVGDKVGLSSIWVLVALLIGGDVFGFLGVLLAVPVAAVVKIFVVRFLDWYRTTDLYAEGAPEEEVGAIPGVLDEEGAPDSIETAVSKAVARDLAHPPGVPEDAAPAAATDHEEE